MVNTWEADRGGSPCLDDLWLLRVQKSDISPSLLLSRVQLTQGFQSDS